MSHFIEICKLCGDVISQCRCPSPYKVEREGICTKCSNKDIKDIKSIKNERNLFGEV